MNASVGSLVGRVIAVIGALVAGISLTQPIVDGPGIKLWDAFEKGPYVILAAVVLTALLTVLSLVPGAGISLVGAAVTASFILGFYLVTWINLTTPYDDLGRAWTLGIAGSATALTGALIALVPMVTGGVGQPAELAFLPQSGAESGRRRSDRPADAGAGGPAPGWYADPADQAQLRYWDGLDWSNHTRSHNGGER